MSMIVSEQDIKNHYDNIWPKFVQWWKADETLAIHHGFYDEDTRTHSEALLKMNDLIWKLLKFDDKQKIEILDAGCGVGGTSIYLAKKHPQATFTGITNVPSHVKLAKIYAKQHQVANNTKFIEGNFCNIELPDNHFDGVFALESSNYALNKTDFIREMYRVLKPGGKLVVVDGFRKNKPLNPIMQKLYNGWLTGVALPGLEYLDKFILCLVNEGFHNVIFDDISQHTVRTYIIGVLIALPFFFSSLIRKMIKFRTHNLLEDTEYTMGVTILASILGVGNYSGYYTLSAVK